MRSGLKDKKQIFRYEFIMKGLFQFTGKLRFYEIKSTLGRSRFDSNRRGVRI